MCVVYISIVSLDGLVAMYRLVLFVEKFMDWSRWKMCIVFV